MLQVWEIQQNEYTKTQFQNLMMKKTLIATSINLMHIIYNLYFQEV